MNHSYACSKLCSYCIRPVYRSKTAYGMLEDMPQPDVVCIGSAVLDIYLKSDKFKQIDTGLFTGGLALCEEFGAKTEIDEVMVTSGGGATNNAVSYAKKGFSVGIVAELGQDLIATTICQELAAFNVDTSFMIQEPGEQSGVSSIMVAASGARSIAVYRGASRMLTKEDIPWDQLRPKWMHLSSLGAHMEVFEGLIGHAKAHDIKLAINPGSYEISQKDNWGGVELYQDIEVLILNRQEAAALTGIDLLDDTVWRNPPHIPGPKRCIITDGKAGGKVFDAGTWRQYEALSTPTIEETGAGDAFGSGFVAALMKDLSADEAIEWGRKQAASVVGHMGPKQGLLRLEEISA